ncbi:hypothetical protein DICVIV_01545 [Dictyocaulus viviparus]|uniref:Uncharacterized protein n=1 Tax=Dictyocaulus viviparus TaxID=29172 RepID=A0A0D8Y7R3_DICVI|nr:hypothetical protein DICVIV_01545 [Dictyocaulus viviparus]
MNAARIPVSRSHNTMKMSNRRKLQDQTTDLSECKLNDFNKTRPTAKFFKDVTELEAILDE